MIGPAPTHETPDGGAVMARGSHGPAPRDRTRGPAPPTRPTPGVPLQAPATARPAVVPGIDSGSGRPRPKNATRRPLPPAQAAATVQWSSGTLVAAAVHCRRTRRAHAARAEAKRPTGARSLYTRPGAGCSPGVVGFRAKIANAATPGCGGGAVRVAASRALRGPACRRRGPQKKPLGRLEGGRCQGDW